MLPFFSLACKPYLEEDLYQKLKQIVENEDDYIKDNSEELNEELEEYRSRLARK